MKSSWLTFAFAVAFLLVISCSPPSTAGGGGSEVEVVGKVLLPGNSPAPATQVKLIPINYDPSVMAAIADSLIDTSDEQGRYSFKNVRPGMYNVQAVQLRQRTRLLVTGLLVDSGTITVEPEILHEPGVIRMQLLNRTLHNGYAIIPGTDIAEVVAAGTSTIIIDSVPVGTIPEVRYEGLGDTLSIVSKSVAVFADDTTEISDPSWLHMQTVLLNTSASGANVRGTLTSFPVLLRLTSDNFTFAEAAADGSDLRFSSVTGKMLPYEIEMWSASLHKAAIWVLVDTVHGNDSLQSITMHWGAAQTSIVEEDEPVFDTAAGFAGVWHLGESPDDASVNHYHGTSPDSATPEVVDGVIGEGRSFDGKEDYMVMPNTAKSSLDFPEDGFFSLSAWVYADTLDHVFRTIATKGYEQYFLQLSYFPGDSALWQFSVFREVDNWNMSHVSAEKQKWVFLTGVRNGTTQHLYVNGELAVNLSAAYNQDTTRNTTNDFSIGRFLKEATFPTNFGNCFFKGKIDEVRVCSRARSADWIKLCYMNQRSDDKLVQFK